MYPAPATPAASSSKGKQRALSPEELAESDVEAEEEAALEQSTFRIHRHAKFTIEKQMKVVEMTQEFLSKLQAFSKDENLDSTAVMRVFERRLSGMQLSSWQAYERLVHLAGDSSCKRCPFYCTHAADKNVPVSR
jgi:hypothetical protein